jgi:Protein of unknown function (DUF4232)
MTLISRKQWRIAAAGIACAAILTPAAALAAPTGLARAARAARPAAPQAAVPRCATSDLRVWLGIPGDSATGHTAYELELSNISGHACTLLGFPRVTAVAPGGGQLGSPAAHDPGDPTRLVTLAHAATAHVFLVITHVAFFPPPTCHPANALGLDVFPPGNRTAAIVPFGFQACAKKGQVFLRVRTTVAGTGIPGFST